MGTNVWPGYEGFHYAEHLGYYDRRQIEVLTFPSSVEAMRAFRNGDLDLVAVTADESFQLIQDEQDPRIILVIDVSHGADAILARPGISHPGDLRGKRVGVEMNAVGVYMLSKGLAIVKRIVQLHGGTIWFESEGRPGFGTAFYLSFSPARPGIAA